MEGCFWRYTEKDTKNTINILIYQKQISLEAATENYSTHTENTF